MKFWNWHLLRQLKIVDFLIRNINVTVGIEYIGHYRLAVDVGAWVLRNCKISTPLQPFFYLMYLNNRLKTIQSTPLLPTKKDYYWRYCVWVLIYCVVLNITDSEYWDLNVHSVYTTFCVLHGIILKHAIHEIYKLTCWFRMLEEVKV